MEWPNLLIIAGTARNVGKTTLAGQIIQQVSAYTEAVGIKITPHFHSIGSECEILQERQHFTIMLEHNKTGNKDSSKMLLAGAQKVFFIQAADAHLLDALAAISPLIPPQTAVIAESAALRNFIKPGLMVMLSKTGALEKNLDLIPMADFHFYDFNFDVTPVRFVNGVWQIS